MGLLNNIIILAILVYASLVVSGKLKMQGKTQEKLESLGLVFKILIYVLTFCFAFIVLKQVFKS